MSNDVKVELSGIPKAIISFSKETKSDLPGKVDHYNGIIIDLDGDQLPQERELFSIVLQGYIFKTLDPMTYIIKTP